MLIQLAELPIPPGHCLACSGVYSQAQMQEHLRNCPARNPSQPTAATPEAKVGNYFELLVEGRQLGAYWLYLEMGSAATLLDLDKFLRRKWLECCGHLSIFKIGNQEYAVEPDSEYNPIELPMRGAKISKVLQEGVGQSFEYEYDYGSTTALKLKLVGEYSRPIVATTATKKVQLLAENQAPEIKCDICGAVGAVKVCTECQWQGAGLYCQKCARQHAKEVHSDYFLPVVNSPRVGVCGYRG